MYLKMASNFGPLYSMHFFPKETILDVGRGVGMAGVCQGPMYPPPQWANPRMDSECASGCTWSMAQATARLWDGRPPE